MNQLNFFLKEKYYAHESNHSRAESFSRVDRRSACTEIAIFKGKDGHSILEIPT